MTTVIRLVLVLLTSVSFAAERQTDDEALARAIALSLGFTAGDPAQLLPSRLEEEAASLRLARELELEDLMRLDRQQLRERGRSCYHHIDNKDAIVQASEAIRLQLKAIHDADVAYLRNHGQDSNVHTYNHMVVRPCYPILKEIDTLLLSELPKSELPLDDIFAALVDNAQTHGYEPLVRDARSFYHAFRERGHWGMEAETGLAIADTLRRCWELANLLPDRKCFAIAPGRQVTPKGLILFAYSENHETEGGCTPGFAGRLYRTYCLLLSRLIAQ